MIKWVHYGNIVRQLRRHRMYAEYVWLQPSNPKIAMGFRFCGPILDMYSFILLYKSMVRSPLDYCSSVWSPYKKGDINAIEKVQKRASEVLPELKNKL